LVSAFRDIRSGSVIRYPFLWPDQAQRGESEGRKTRPTAVGLRVPRAGGRDILVLFPITSKTPAPGRFVVEIPDIEKQRAGLATSMRLWIILDEGNQDIVGDSFYLMPESMLGRFSRAFFVPLMTEVIRRRPELRIIKR
jgi:hypothetical protein